MKTPVQSSLPWNIVTSAIFIITYYENSHYLLQIPNN